MSTLLRTAFQFDMERLWPGMNRNSPDLERVFHIHRASWKRLAERVLSTKFLFSLLNIYFRLIGYQSSCLIIHVLYGSNCHDNSGTETCLIIWRSTFIHFQDRRGAASPRFFPTVFICEQKPNLIWISFPGVRASWYTVNIVLAPLD